MTYGCHGDFSSDIIITGLLIGWPSAKPHPVMLSLTLTRSQTPVSLTIVHVVLGFMAYVDMLRGLLGYIYRPFPIHNKSRYTFLGVESIGFSYL